VKDPQCQIHIPESNALSAELEGRVYYFCSLKCLKQFKRQKGEVKSET
jgi:YHS domain-containing protein